MAWTKWGNGCCCSHEQHLETNWTRSRWSHTKVVTRKLYKCTHRNRLEKVCNWSWTKRSVAPCWFLHPVPMAIMVNLGSVAEKFGPWTVPWLSSLWSRLATEKSRFPTEAKRFERVSFWVAKSVPLVLKESSMYKTTGKSFLQLPVFSSSRLHSKDLHKERQWAERVNPEVGTWEQPKQIAAWHAKRTAF